MKTKYIYILLLGIIPLLGIGCEDRLDIAKHGNLGGQEDFYKTDDDAMQALASLYTTWGGSYFNWFFTKNLLADDVWCGGGKRGDSPDMERLNEYNFNTNHGMIESLYSDMYSIIYKANLIIDRLEADTDIKKRIIAEAKFFRAWAHFELVTLFGTAPVVDHLLQTNEYRQSNGTPEQTWNIIEQDLTEAINSGNLPSKTDANDSETTIRITHEVAQAMLGKAYVFQGKYGDAATILDKVIESDKYQLWTGDYDKLLHVAANNSSESMLEVQKRYDFEQAWAQMTMTYLMMGWRTEFLSFSGQAAADLATGTYGFMNPRQTLYDAFVEMEGQDGYRLLSSIRTKSQVEDYGVSLHPGAILFGHEGLFMWKTRALNEDNVYDASYFQALQYINLRVMRYAEVLLLAAEAHVMGGSQDKAVKYINQIRTRAQLGTLSSVTLDDVKKEKRLELCMESVRFQDLVRWGDAQAAMGEQGKQVPTCSNEGIQYPITNTIYGFQEKHKLLPIPLKEIVVNPNMKQNAFWTDSTDDED